MSIPHDPVSEVAVIVSAMVDESARKHLLPRFRPESFFGAGHSAWWDAVKQCVENGLTPDVNALKRVAGDRLDYATIEEHLRSFDNKPAQNLDKHVGFMQWDHVRAQAVKGPVSSFLEAIKDPTSDPERVSHLARQIGNAFGVHGDLRYLHRGSDYVAEHARILTERRTGLASYPFHLQGFDTYGPDDFDERNGVRRSLNGKPRVLPGAAPRNLIVVTGVSGSCKTTATARSVLGWIEQGRKVLWGAWEQRPSMSLELLATMSLGWSRTDMMGGDYTEAEEKMVLEEMERIGSMFHFLDLPFGRTREEVKRGQLNERNLDRVQEYLTVSGADIFIADLMRRAFREIEPDAEEQALQRVQTIAYETDCAIVALQQLRLKDVETRADKRPTRESIKGSAAWVEMPDTIIGWHREHMFSSGVPDTKAEALILKQRYGKPSVVEFDWDPEFATITNGKTIEIQKDGERGEMEEFLSNVSAPKRLPGKGQHKRR